MDINCYMAMTAPEITRVSPHPHRIGWLSSHFSERSNGLCNLPDALPEGAVLILDDSTPPAGHDPEEVAVQLNMLVQKSHLQVVILDFQNPNQFPTEEMTAYLLSTLTCKVCVAAPYAKPHNCPVLIPAPMPHRSPQKHISPWRGREIWIEATLDTERITVTEQGSTITVLPYQEPEGHWFTEERLCCRYQIQELETQVEFTLTRDMKMLKQLLENCQQLGVSYFIGLYQQLGTGFP